MQPLLRSFFNWVDQIHLNESSVNERDGRRVVVKRRRPWAGMVLRLANGFFRLAKNPVEAVIGNEAWQRWEVDCFRRLHGPTFASGLDKSGSAWIEVLPGRSLSDALAAGTLDTAMLQAAGAELRRAHNEPCPHYGEGWSHGDPHTGNFLYDPTAGRARLIDFEVRHLREMPAHDRHADDVLVLLQDICGRCSADQWRSLARAVLEGYGKSSVTSRIRDRLEVPGGIPRLWWAVRTTWMRRRELESRLSELREVLEDRQIHVPETSCSC